MRRHLIREFDAVYIDNLNGDSRETGKKTPSGEQDPSVFASKLNPAGIQVGTSISLLVRREHHEAKQTRVFYRDFWGTSKAEQLVNPEGQAEYEPLSPDESNWFRLRRWQPRAGYSSWPQVVDLAAARPDLGLNENRGEALIAVDREALVARMRHFLDPNLRFDELDGDTAAGLLEPWADYDPEKTRSKLLSESPYDERRLRLIQVRPLDVRWAYVDVTPKLWNRSRPAYVQASMLGGESLLVRRRAPRALDGASFLLSAQLVDQHVLHKDAYTIPLLLPARESPDVDRLFALDDEELEGVPWRPNLSAMAAAYLQDLGFLDIDTSRSTARLLWLHCLATGYAPLYLEENADAIRNSWPRVPLPRTREMLEASAQLGARLAALLDVDTPLPGLDADPLSRLKPIASIGRVDGAPGPLELSLTAGWAVAQTRTVKSGAVGRVVMPGDGRVNWRFRSADESATLSDHDRQMLGDEIVDVCLNAETAWLGVPGSVWNYKIGGYQVLRKWLAYREEAILGRPLTLAEARQFQSIARRLAELVRLEPDLNANYQACTGTVEQDPLPLVSVASD